MLASQPAEGELERLQREFEQQNPQVAEAMRVLGLSMRSYLIAMQALHGRVVLTAGAESDELGADLERTQT